MNIVSFEFLGFVAIIVLLNQLIPTKYRRLLIAGASLYYAWTFSPFTLFTLLLVSAIAFLAGYLITHQPGMAKWTLWISVATIVFLMVGYRWINSAADTLSFTARINIVIIGLSFYGMEAISYIIDTYYSKKAAFSNPIDTVEYLSFFPTLLSGPIKKADDFAQQTHSIEESSRKEQFDLSAVRNGIFLMIWGYFLKLVIADRLTLLVDSVYERYFIYGTVVLGLTAAAYSLQLYCDFMSYSMIAAGIAVMLGYRVPDNFQEPYMAVSISDFWRKWHISLSSWLRDYIYIPLGGNRKGKVRQYLNTLITFAVSGIWHGFGLSFLAWGVLHGFCVVVENLLKTWKSSHNNNNLNQNELSDAGSVFLKRILMFIIVTVLWIFFRSASLSDAIIYIWRMLTNHDLWVLSGGRIASLGLDAGEMNIAFFGLFILYAVSRLLNERKMTFLKWINGESCVFRVLFGVLLLAGIIVFGKYGPGFDTQSFIYSQF